MFNLVINNKKKIIVSLISVMILFLGLTFLFKKGNNYLTERQRKLMQYDQVQNGDEAVSGTSEVTFDAFFLEDLDNDGNADGIRGETIQLGDTKKLYIQLNVSGDVILTNGQIQFINSNVRVAGSIKKGTLVSENQSSNNFSSINLKDINTGTSILLSSLQVNSNLTNDLNSYSGINKVILTGTVTDLNGNKITDIEKEVPYTVDWYGDKINANISSSDSSIEMVGHTPTAKYKVTATETEGELFLKTAYLETYIAPLSNGLEPVNVTVSGDNITYNYDSATHMLTARRNAVLDDTLIVTNAYNNKNETVSYNYWNINVEYEDSETLEDVYGTINAKVWYDAFNNGGIKTSNEASKVVTVKTKTTGHGGTVNIWDHSNIIAISNINKVKTLNIYNVVEVDDPYSEYNIKWTVYVPSVLNDGNKGGNTHVLSINDNDGEKFNDSVSMKEYVSYKTIKFSGLDETLNSTGSAVLIDSDTNEVIHVFTALDWNTPYTFEGEIKSIIIKLNGFKYIDYGTTTGQCFNSFSYCNFRNQLKFNVEMTKTVDNEAIANNINFDDFDSYGSVTSQINTYSYNVGELIKSTNDKQSATFKGMTSEVYLSSNKSVIDSTDETEVELSISTNNIDELASGFKNGEFYLLFPEELLDAKLMNVSVATAGVNVDLTEEGRLANGQKYIKIVTSNDDATKLNIKVTALLVPNPLNLDSVLNITLYAYNPECHDYIHKTADIYDINLNNDVSEKVGYATTNISITAPIEIVTTSILKEYNNSNNTSVAPMVAEVNPIEDDPEATVEIGITNNSEYAAKDIIIIGKIAYEDNTYQIGGGNLGSEYDVHMTDEGLKIPTELEGNVTIYYSEKETPTTDLTDTNNGWKLKDATDFTKVKSYMIIFDNDYDMEVGKTLTFTYDIEMPITTQNLNKVTYFTHGVYYNLVTPAGLYAASVGGSKLGIRMSRQYDVELTNLKAYSNKTISGTKYIIEDEDGNQKAFVTGNNGKFVAKDLYVGTEYTLKQISINNPYILDEEAKTFKLVNGANDVVSLESNGSLKSIELTNNKIVSIVHENETKYDVVLTNTDLDTDELLYGSKFKVTGKGYETGKTFRTNTDGQLSIKNLYLGETYEIEQVSVNNHILTNKFTISIARDTNGEIKISVVDKPTFDDIVNIYNGFEYDENGNIGRISSSKYDENRGYIPFDLTKYSKEYKLSFNLYSRTTSGWYSPVGSFYAVVTDNYNNVINESIYDSPFIDFYSTIVEDIEYSTNITGGKKYYLYMYQSTGNASYDNSFYINNLELEPVDGKYESFLVDEKQNVAAFENSNATQTLLDNNQDTPVLNVEVKNKSVPTYTLEITKVDAETNEPLAGAQYVVTGPGLPDSGKYLTTDINGNASIKLNKKYIASGNYSIINGVDYSQYESEYTIKEVAAPIGYTIDKKSVKFTGSLYINHGTLDDSSYPYVYNTNLAQENDNIVGYALDSETQFKEATWIDNDTLSVKMSDYPIARLIKTDAETGNALPNTLFSIYKVQRVNGNEILAPATDSNGNIVGTPTRIDGKDYYIVQTDDEGKINFNLGVGQYKLIEVQAADEKYELSKAVYYFGIGETVPYKSATINLIDSLDVGEFYQDTQNAFNKLTATSDNGFIVTAGQNVIKYDSDLNIEWQFNYYNDVSYSGSYYEYTYFDDPTRVTIQNTSNDHYSPSQVYETSDGGYIISTSDNGLFAKFDRDGNLLWKNQESYYNNHSVLDHVCTYEGNTDANGNVLMYNYDSSTDTWYPSTTWEYNPDTGNYDEVPYYVDITNPDYYGGSFTRDNDTYYCHVDYGQYYYNRLSSYYKRIAPTTDGGALMLVHLTTTGSQEKIRLSDGTLYNVEDVDYLFRYDRDGNLVQVINVDELISQYNQEYMQQYNITTNSLTYNYYPSHYVYHEFMETYPNGDVLIIRYPGIAIKLKYNATTDSYEKGFFNPLGAAGDRLYYSVYDDNDGVIDVKLDEDGGFRIMNSNYALNRWGNQNDPYFSTDMQEFEFMDKYSMFNNSFYIFKYDNQGFPDKATMIATTYRNPEDVALYNSNDFRRIYGTPNGAGYATVEDGYIVGSTRVGFYDYNGAYSVELADGNTVYISDETVYVIYKVNFNNQVEWIKQYKGFYPSTGNSNIKTVKSFDGTKLLFPIRIFAGRKVEEIGNDDIPLIENTSSNDVYAFLVFDYSETAPSGPEAYTLNIENNRKEYKINATSNLGGEVVVTNPDNGQNVVTAGAGTETLERVKYGDTNKYDITIVPSEHYSVASVQLNGKEAPYTVNADGSVTLNKIEDIKEDKNISIIYAKNKSQVIVKHYLKDTTNSVFGDDIIIGESGDPYETEPQQSELYSLATDETGEIILPGNMTGNYASTPITVIYYYQENEVDLKVNYYLEGTDTELAPSSIQRKVLGSSYQTAPLDIEFYELSRTIGDESGTLTRNLTEVTYMYSQNNEATITIRHVDKATNQDLVTPITKTVTRHDTYTTDDPVTIPAKYRLTETPANATGPAENANIEVIYYYEVIPFNVSVDKRINSILLNGEKQTITDSKNVTISPAKKDNLIVYYEINLKNTGDIKANFTVVEGDIPGFVIYDKGNFTKTNNGYELVAELEPGEEKTYRIGYKWNQKDYGISTNKVELKEVTNDKGFDEPDALDNISTATIETKIPKAVLGEPIEIIPNTLDNIPAMIMLLITSIVGIITSLILIRKRRMN